MSFNYLELSKFNHIKYFDEPHKYFNDKGEEYVSATTFIKKFKKEFQTQIIAEQYAAKREPQITWLYTKSNTLKKECYDQSDAYCAVLGYMKMEGFW